uniref:Uncharacterized protein n=1 Tax=Anguilla anguilla TaxID=7936 RepID=A0A0E9S0K5_ANGAN
MCENQMSSAGCKKENEHKEAHF